MSDTDWIDDLLDAIFGKEVPPNLHEHTTATEAAIYTNIRNEWLIRRVEAKAAIEQKLTDARIDELKEQIRVLDNTIDLIPDDHEYGSGKKHQQTMIMVGLQERITALQASKEGK